MLWMVGCSALGIQGGMRGQGSDGGCVCGSGDARAGGHWLPGGPQEPRCLWLGFWGGDFDNHCLGSTGKGAKGGPLQDTVLGPVWCSQEMWLGWGPAPPPWCSHRFGDGGHAEPRGRGDRGRHPGSPAFLKDLTTSVVHWRKVALLSLGRMGSGDPGPLPMIHGCSGGGTEPALLWAPPGGVDPFIAAEPF